MTKPAPESKTLFKFRSEAAERAFWEADGNDATQSFGPAKLRPARFKNLKPSTTSISIRRSDSLLEASASRPTSWMLRISR